MKEINIPKAKKLIDRQKFTKPCNKTDLQLAVEGAENGIYFCVVWLLMFFTSNARDNLSLTNALTQLGFITFLVLMFIRKLRLSKIRDYLIANNVQNLDELKR